MNLETDVFVKSGNVELCAWKNLIQLK
jgi:hypothetical protein